jgi:hypothetical protein
VEQQVKQLMTVNRFHLDLHRLASYKEGNFIDPYLVNTSSENKVNAVH